MNVPEPPDITKYTVYAVKRNDETVLTTTDKQKAQNYAMSIAGTVEEIQSVEPATSEEVVQ